MGKRLATEIRDKKLYDRYMELIRIEGDKAVYLSREYFYDKLSKEFLLTPRTVKALINKYLKDGHRKNN